MLRLDITPADLDRIEFVCSDATVQNFGAARSGIEMPAAEGLLFEATLFGLCAATADMKEGMTAFLEKRPARFTGK